MKQILLVFVFLLSAFSSLASGLGIMPSPLPVDMVRTGLREVSPNSFRGPIEIMNTSKGVVMIVNDNTCTINGICTERSLLNFNAVLVLNSEDSNAYYYSVYLDVSFIKIIDDVELINPITLKIDKHGLQGTLTTILNVYPLMPHAKVTMHNGVATCNDFLGAA